MFAYMKRTMNISSLRLTVASFQLGTSLTAKSPATNTSSAIARSGWAAINHEHMPVLLNSEAEFDKWIERTTEEALALATPYDAAQMQLVQSGLKKEDFLA